MGSGSYTERKRAAQEFVRRWEALPGAEEEHARSFWIELLEVLGVEHPTRVLDFERKVKGRKIDVFYEDMGILVEHKGRGVSLDEATVRSQRVGLETPYQQAKWYADNLPHSIRPRWIITCNFDEFRIYDLERAENSEKTYTPLFLAELPEQLHLLSFFTDTSCSRLVKERELSVEAGEIVGELYRAFSQQYQSIDTDKHEQRSLNVLIVRLVFLLYAEDAGLLHDKQAFGNYLCSFPAHHMRGALKNLFCVLDIPEKERDPYLNPELAAFPYVNGGLFSDGGGVEVIIPQITEEIRQFLLRVSAEFDWSNISPTIFGAVFESTLNPEMRREGGMHYTSIENIHKVIDPLFLDDLKAELASIESGKVERTRIRQLRNFQKKISELTFLDPAAGSHNFLTETYLSLRALELRIIEDIQGDQTSLLDPTMVHLGQLHAIEINDFAVAVGKTALWIAEEQMLARTQELLPYQECDFLPLRSCDTSHCANALTLDWNEVLPAEECDYVIGNPPFIGYSNLSPQQKRDRALIFENVKSVDYVACWYKKAADYIRGTHARCAFVSTSSICQGQQVKPLWQPLFSDGIRINFAWQTFVWANAANEQAHVHVVVIGFSREERQPCLFTEKQWVNAKNINGYLRDAPNVFMDRRAQSLCNATAMFRGCEPTDGGHLLLDAREREELLQTCPQAEKWIRPFSMGAEFIKGTDRYCLWLVDATWQDIVAMPPVHERVEAVKSFRLASTKAATVRKAHTPWLFGEVKQFHGKSYLAIPKVSSERRAYIPIGFVTNGMIPGDKLFVLSGASLYDFGVLTSQAHNAWMRVVCGRLESRYSYSNTIVYNNFPWPGVTRTNRAVPVREAVDSELRARIEVCAQAVLDARALYPDFSLATLYDPDTMPPDLKDAHSALDAAVEAAYGMDFAGDEKKIVATLFQLYSELTAEC